MKFWFDPKVTFKAIRGFENFVIEIAFGKALLFLTNMGKFRTKVF